MQVRDMIERKTAISCTDCRYCMPHCPKQIPIPQYIKMYNAVFRYPGDKWRVRSGYNDPAFTAGKASDCIGCHRCEQYCPQNLKISQHMKTIAEELG